jgi:hypothetical protein
MAIKAAELVVSVKAEGFTKAGRDIDQLVKEEQKLQQEQKKVDETTKSNTIQLSFLATALKKVQEFTKDLKNKSIEATKEGLSKLGEKTKELTTNLGKMALDKSVQGIRSLGNIAKNVAQDLANLSVNGFNKLTQGIKNLTFTKPLEGLKHLKNAVVNASQGLQSLSSKGLETGKVLASSFGSGIKGGLNSFSNGVKNTSLELGKFVTKAGSAAL